MRATRVCLVILFALGAGSGLLAQTPVWEQFEYPPINNFERPDLEIFELDNGIRFYLVEDDELPLINLNVIVRTGGILVPEEKVGLNTITGTVMRAGGTATYPADELNELLEDRAASMETSIGFSAGAASMNVLSEDFDELLPVFVDLLQNPAFPDDQIELAKTQQRTLIGRRNDEQAGIANREFQRLIYGDEARYGRRTEYATIDNISRQDLVNFHARSFVGRNLMIGVVGDFTVPEMKRKLEEAFSAMPAGEALQPEYPPVDYTFPTTINIVDKRDVNQSYVLLGHIGGMRSNPDYARLQVMNRVLSGGFSSRLMQVVRSELGLAYSVFGSYGSGTWFPGTFTTGVMTRSETTAAAIEAIIGQIRRLQEEPISAQELEQTKDQFLNSLVFQYPSRSAVLLERMNNDYAGLPPDTFERLVEEIRNVTIADVQQMARRYLRPDAMQILVVGNAEEIGDQLEALGAVREIDISIPEPAAEPVAAPVLRDAAEASPDAGREWMQRMAQAILPEGRIPGAIRVESDNFFLTPVGESLLPGRDILNFKDMQYYSELDSAEGLIITEIAHGRATRKIAGQQVPLQGSQLYQIVQRYRMHYINLAMRADRIETGYKGEAKVDGEPAVQLLLKTDPQIDLYLARETALPLRLRTMQVAPSSGESREIEIFYNDWKVSDGVAMAYSARSLVNGGQQAHVKVRAHAVLATEGGE